MERALVPTSFVPLGGLNEILWGDFRVEPGCHEGWITVKCSKSFPFLDSALGFGRQGGRGRPSLEELSLEVKTDLWTDNDNPVFCVLWDLTGSSSWLSLWPLLTVVNERGHIWTVCSRT